MEQSADPDHVHEVRPHIGHVRLHRVAQVRTVDYVPHLAPGVLQAQVCQLEPHTARLVQAVEQQHHVLVVGQLAAPDVELVSFVLDPADVGPGPAKFVLVDGDDFLVAESGEGAGGHVANVAADDERRLEEGPEGEVGLVLVVSHALVAHLEHVGVVPAVGPPEELLPDLDVQVLHEALPVVQKVPRVEVAPAVRDVPDVRAPDRLDQVAPRRHRVEDRPPRLVQRLAHPAVLLQVSEPRHPVAVVILQEVNSPPREVVRVQLLEAQPARLKLASPECTGGVNTKLQALRVDVVPEALKARGEGPGADHDRPVREAVALGPAVVQVYDDVSLGGEAGLNELVGRGLDEALVNVAVEGVPGVPAHVGFPPQPVVVSEGGANNSYYNHCADISAHIRPYHLRFSPFGSRSAARARHQLSSRSMLLTRSTSEAEQKDSAWVSNTASRYQLIFSSLKLQTECALSRVIIQRRTSPAAQTLALKGSKWES